MLPLLMVLLKRPFDGVRSVKLQPRQIARRSTRLELDSILAPLCNYKPKCNAWLKLLDAGRDALCGFGRIVGRGLRLPNVMWCHRLVEWRDFILRPKLRGL